MKELDGWAAVIGVNLNGVFFCSRAEIPAMLKSGGGSIVNMASSLGSVGIEYAQQGICCNSVGPVSSTHRAGSRRSRHPRRHRLQTREQPLG